MAIIHFLLMVKTFFFSVFASELQCWVQLRKQKFFLRAGNMSFKTCQKLKTTTELNTSF